VEKPCSLSNRTARENHYHDQLEAAEEEATKHQVEIYRLAYNNALKNIYKENPDLVPVRIMT